MGLTVPRRAQYLRTVIGELERMHSHLLWLGVAAHEIGFNTLFMWTWRDREIVQDVLEELTGNCVNYGMNEIGGVRRDVSEALIARTLIHLKPLHGRFTKYAEIIEGERTIRVRFKGIGRLSREEALRHGTVGPTARASTFDTSASKDDARAPPHANWQTATTSHQGDVLGRT